MDVWVWTGQGLARAAPHALAVWVWLYCLLWWFVQDAAKVGTYMFLKKKNIFDILEINALKDPMENRQLNKLMTVVTKSEDRMQANDDKRRV